MNRIAAFVWVAFASLLVSSCTVRFVSHGQDETMGQGQQDAVWVCHGNQSPRWHAVAAPAADAHRRHGDAVSERPRREGSSCTNEDRRGDDDRGRDEDQNGDPGRTTTIWVCHGNQSPQWMAVSGPSADAHRRHGDPVSTKPRAANAPCGTPDPDTDEDPDPDERRNEDQGPGPSETLWVCHGNQNPRWMGLPSSSADAHRRHGDPVSSQPRDEGSSCVNGNSDPGPDRDEARGQGQGQGQGRDEARGQGQGQGQGRDEARGKGPGQGPGQGQGRDEARGQGPGQGPGQGQERDEARGQGQGQGQGQDQGPTNRPDRAENPGQAEGQGHGQGRGEAEDQQNPVQGPDDIRRIGQGQERGRDQEESQGRDSAPDRDETQPGDRNQDPDDSRDRDEAEAPSEEGNFVWICHGNRNPRWQKASASVADAHRRHGDRISSEPQEDGSRCQEAMG